MSQRVARLESVIQQIVATKLLELLGQNGAGVTVTRVDAAPDLRNATVWIGLLGEEPVQERLWNLVLNGRSELQAAVGARMTTKFVPHLHLKRDTGGEYAAEIDRLLRGL